MDPANAGVAHLKALSKQLLVEGLEALNPINAKQNVIFYELSSETGYVFAEPIDQLLTVSITRQG